MGEAIRREPHPALEEKMTLTATALLGFVAWTVLLVVLLGVFRVTMAVSGKQPGGNFKASGEDLDGFGKRLTRAHANCYEFLPVAGAVMLYAIATGQTGLTDGLAYAFIGARIAQSVVHMASTAQPAVLVRFALFIVQLVIVIMWLLKLTGHI